MPSEHDQNFNLTFLDRFDIRHEEERLHEPSGLALSHGKNALWTVSDDTRKIFKLDLSGDIKRHKSFDVPEQGLEGITLDPAGANIFVVKEETNEIIKIEVASRALVQRRRLADMDGYETLAPYFSDGIANKGLEGIAWNTETGTVFVMKEGRPGLLIEVSADLRTIIRYQLLNRHNGFFDTVVADSSVDFSDICYDESRDRFWILSDKARRVFLYDWGKNSVISSAKLGYGKDGKYKEIKKAEGIAIDPGAHRLYVVSDREARLYVFDIRA